MKIYRWNNLKENQKKIALSRPVFSHNKGVKRKVENIISQVKLRGDKALFLLTKKYDGAQLSALRVADDEFAESRKQVSLKVREAIEFAKTQIESHHKQQLPFAKIIKTCEGVFCERQLRSIERVGLYIPSGSAPLVSTVLMLGVPAQIANCPLRVICTPPNEKGEIDANILMAAQLCDIKDVYKVGGAQAIAAMAYGTESIPKVDKIFGPGNAWVTQAKILVAQDIQGASIDMPAGPSELMVIADDNVVPDYVAADLLSQAEHGVDSQVMLVVFSEYFALKVESCLNQQLKILPRRNIAKQSLENSRMIIVDDMQQAIAISNAYAAEHLILQVDNPQQYVPLIQNAGAVFLGPWSPETVGDYVTGANHVLPTYGCARSFSGLSTMDFMKFINFQTVTRQGLKKIGPFAEKLAEIEGLQAHKNAISLRLASRENNNE